MICSGWDPYKGYQIYSVNQTGFFTEADWALSGSGSTFIWGYFDANFRSNMKKEEAIEFVSRVSSYHANSFLTGGFRHSFLARASWTPFS